MNNKQKIIIAVTIVVVLVIVIVVLFWLNNKPKRITVVDNTSAEDTEEYLVGRQKYFFGDMGEYEINRVDDKFYVNDCNSGEKWECSKLNYFSSNDVCVQIDKEWIYIDDKKLQNSRINGTDFYEYNLDSYKGVISDCDKDSANAKILMYAAYPDFFELYMIKQNAESNKYELYRCLVTIEYMVMSKIEQSDKSDIEEAITDIKASVPAIKDCFPSVGLIGDNIPW